MSGYKLILNEELPIDLRKELEEDALMRDLTLNDAATRILADRFKTDWNQSRRGYRQTSMRFKLRVPDELHRKMRIYAANNSQTIRGVALNVLTTHYETDIVDPKRRARRKVA